MHALPRLANIALTLLHSEGPKLYGVLAIQSAIGFILNVPVTLGAL